MLRQISVTVLAASLSLFALPTMPSATAVALRGDGHCPTERYSSDPDCAREGSQQLSKSSRNEFPRCMNGTCTNRRSTAVVAGRHQGDQFPGNRQGGGSGPALPAPRAV
jgi:hypothetical protein